MMMLIVIMIDMSLIKIEPSYNEPSPLPGTVLVELEVTEPPPPVLLVRPDETVIRFIVTLHPRFVVF
jgi:hypothetical protein